MWGKKLPPLHAVQSVEKGPNEEAVGTIATEANEVDSIVRKAYDKIFAGNKGNQQEATEEYMKEYGRFIYRSPKANLTPLAGKTSRRWR